MTPIHAPNLRAHSLPAWAPRAGKECGAQIRAWIGVMIAQVFSVLGFSIGGLDVVDHEKARSDTGACSGSGRAGMKVSKSR